MYIRRTHTIFEGAAAANPKAQRGHSKEKRSDCPLVTLGLVLDGSGFVRRSQTFDGAVSEGTTLDGMLRGLGAPRGALVVMDAGIATAENIRWLRTQGDRYLVVSRERQRQFDATAATSLTTARGEALAIQRVLDADGEEVRLFEIDADATGKTAQAIRWERQPVAGTMLTHPGVYCLRTNELTWDAERLWRTYTIAHRLGGRVPLAEIRIGLAPDLL